ncbi:MAG: imidazoleglycerol-phosphate dehydratase HisB [Planctomycetes bacterium]|nr:imidazoleglycerol-phosphate dehydratase HisB [Planctomycetota bacterium]
METTKAGTTKGPRKATVSRTTRETSIRLELSLDEPAPSEISTGIGFFDHMLQALAKHGRLGLKVQAQGDLHVDQHHLVEDVGIALGTALREALGDDLRIRRFAHAYAPLDDALARAVVDVSGRAHLYYGVQFARPLVGAFDADLVRELFAAFVANAAVSLHLDLIRGENAHHQVEAVFKAFALALRDAVAREPGLAEVPSTKGTLSEKAARKARKVGKLRKGKGR